MINRYIVRIVYFFISASFLFVTTDLTPLFCQNQDIQTSQTLRTPSIWAPLANEERAIIVSREVEVLLGAERLARAAKKHEDLPKTIARVNASMERLFSLRQKSADEKRNAGIDTKKQEKDLAHGPILFSKDFMWDESSQTLHATFRFANDVPARLFGISYINIFNHDYDIGARKTTTAAHEEELLKQLGFEHDDHGRLQYGDGYAGPQLDVDLWIVPHGQTYANVQKLMQGCRSDDNPASPYHNPLSRLNDEGEKQAERGAEALWHEFGERIKQGEQIVFLTSPMKRARQTAEAFRKYADSKGCPDVRIEVEPQAVEIDFGEWDGRLTSELEREGIEARTRQHHRDAFARPQLGESFIQFLSRVREFMESLNRRYKGETVVVFGHGTFTSALKILLKTGDITLPKGYIDWGLYGPKLDERGQPIHLNTLRASSAEHQIPFEDEPINDIKALAGELNEYMGELPKNEIEAIDKTVIVMKKGMTESRGAIGEVAGYHYKVMKQNLEKLFKGRGIIEVDTQDEMIESANPLIRDGLRVIVLDDGTLSEGLENKKDRITGRTKENFCLVSADLKENGDDSTFFFVNLNAMSLMGIAILADDRPLFEKAYRIFRGRAARDNILSDFKNGLLWILRVLPRSVPLTDRINATYLQKLFSAAA